MGAGREGSQWRGAEGAARACRWLVVCYRVGAGVSENICPHAKECLPFTSLLPLQKG